MSSLSGWKRLFRLDESSGHLDRNIDEELRFHIEERIEYLISTGMSPEDARAEAMHEFGGEIEETKADLHKIGEKRFRRRALTESLRSIMRDIRLAARSYLKRPGFALTVILIIALGVGATTTIFSVIDGVMLKRLPYDKPGQLIYFDNAAHPVPHYRDWKARITSFSSMAASWDMEVDYTGGESPQRLSGTQITSEFFSIFGVSSAIGRLFLPEDFSGMPEVVILSHGTWQRVFGGDPSILGQTISLSGFPAVVVGVLEESFTSPSGMISNEFDLWVPLDITRPDIQRSNWYVLEVIARLKPRVSISSARAEMDRLELELAAENPDLYTQSDGSPEQIEIIPLHSALVGRISGSLLLLFASVGLLLAIACSNVANLFLARGTDRIHEVAIMYSLGAGRRHLVGQLLIESSLLSLIGGIFGVLIALFGVRAFEIINPGRIPMVDRIGVDLRVLCFAFVISLLTGILFGLIPAWQASRVNVTDAINDSSMRWTGGRGKTRLRNSLVVAEIALALVLLVGAGLLFNSFMRLRAVDPGFNPEGIISIPLDLDDPPYGREQRLALYRQLLESMKGMPGVEEVSVADTVPFLYFGSIRHGSASSEFRNELGDEIESQTFIHPIAPRYFASLGSILRGREFTATDPGTQPVPTVISDGLARQLYPGTEAVGRTFFFRDETFRIVGVVEGMHHWGLDQGVTSEMYVPWESYGPPYSRLNLLVKTSNDPRAMIPALQQAIWRIEPDLPITQIHTMTERISYSLVVPRFYSALLMTFAAVAILLAAGGIYGSMLYNVGQRRRELGIRTALGADSGRLLRMVVGQGARLTLIGVVIGVVGALAATRALEHMVFGISTTDMPTFIAVIGLLGFVAIAASFIPAWRAAAADPVEALRIE